VLLKELTKHVKDRFSLTISPHRLSFVHLTDSAGLLRPAGSFTLLRESLGAMVLGYRALCRVTPSVFLDTTGCAFTYVPARLLFGCRVVAYVHYPTISTDMLQLVRISCEKGLLFGTISF
jgi:alpha-1,2-mannosyltransferase